MHRLKTVCISLYLILSLSACAPATVVRVPEIQRIYPDAALVRATPVPEFVGKTYGELVEYILDLKAGILACNTDKASIRALRERFEDAGDEY